MKSLVSYFRNKQKRTVLILLSLVCLSNCFALPGIAYYVPDTSGEYIYYRDNTFTKSSIVGFLYYDDTNYAIRYYSPASLRDGTLEKDITLYITIDSNDPKITMTGESIVGASGQEDTDIINYLHDLFYDFAKYRNTLILKDYSDKSVKTSLDYFGGDVKLVYNALLPIFNLSKVTKANGDILLEVETAGLLTSSADTSFSDFKGITGLPQDKNRNFTSDKKAIKSTEIYNGQSITLDSQWSKTFADNVWLLGDYALITVNEINIPESYSNYKEFYYDLLIRKLSLGTDHSYSVWSHRNLKQNQKSTTINSVFYQNQEEAVTRDFKIITKINDSQYAYFTLTVFDSVYQNNKKYFDSIIKSYKIK